jgi:hypothetical protein
MRSVDTPTTRPGIRWLAGCASAALAAVLFAVPMALPASASPHGRTSVKVEKSTGPLGTVFVSGTGRTLYVDVHDSTNHVTCTGDVCPVVAASAVGPRDNEASGRDRGEGPRHRPSPCAPTAGHVAQDAPLSLHGRRPSRPDERPGRGCRLLRDHPERRAPVGALDSYPVHRSAHGGYHGRPDRSGPRDHLPGPVRGHQRSERPTGLEPTGYESGRPEWPTGHEPSRPESPTGDEPSRPQSAADDQSAHPGPGRGRGRLLTREFEGTYPVL